MQKKKIYILESNEDFAKRLSDYFTLSENFELCGVCEDGEFGVEQVLKLKPDILLISLLLKNIDGLEVLDRLKFSSQIPLTIVMSSFSDDNIANRALSKGAKYYLIKPFDPALAEARINEIIATSNKEQSSEPVVKRSIASIDEKISNIFISIGIPPHIKGYNFLREGIKMATHKPEIINNITKELYPKIGEKYETSASKVERAIRHAIEVAWNKNRIDAINAVFGSRVYIGTEKPTNSEFIALVADKLILENLTNGIRIS